MAEETTATEPQAYRDYRQERMSRPPAADDPAPTAAETPETPEAVTQDSPPASDEDSEEKGPDQGQQAKRRDRTENRFKRLNDRARSLERENAELRGRVDTLQEMMQGRQSSNTSSQETPPSTRPRRDAFEDEETYLDAVEDWRDHKLETALAAQRQDIERVQERMQAEQTQTTYAERLETARQRYSDYDDVVETADVTVNDDVTGAILDSEVGPEIVYYLAQHPDEAVQLNAMRSPVALGRALGKIEAKLLPPSSETDTSQESPPSSEPPSRAPEPITPVSGTTPGNVNRPTDQLPYRDYRARRLKELRQRRD